MYKCYQDTVCLYTHCKKVNSVREFPFVMSDMWRIPGCPYRPCGMYVYICQLYFYEFLGLTLDMYFCQLYLTGHYIKVSFLMIIM